MIRLNEEGKYEKYPFDTAVSESNKNLKKKVTV